MNAITLVGGLLCLGLILQDFVKTTLSLQGGGLITKSVSKVIWTVFLKLANGNGRSALLPHAGYTILITIFMIWLAGIWLGLFLVLQSSPVSVLHSSSGAVASSWEKFYFAGYVLSTMGNGDFQPNGMPWLVLASVFSFLGLALITVSITYFIPVLSAVNSQKTLAVFINAIGDTPQQILINSWNGKDFSRFLSHGADLTTMLLQYTQNHLVYPIIHYFHSKEPKQSVVISIAMLNEALTLMVHAVAEGARPNDKELHMLQKSLQFYRNTVNEIYELKENASLPQPDLSLLKEAGIPLQSNHNSSDNQDLPAIRRVYARLLANAGWNWLQVYSSKF
ncbi:potassium channel family protein [Pontibacter beigongshangensis]|uniref:potassium channel family protein n=1 Tax=Pontibacter beigongshangensis TaxID=2574733 RepID=UPI0016509FED|nr:potassium channel family protein [Pontibacter beigongshangensis]